MEVVFNFQYPDNLTYCIFPIKRHRPRHKDFMSYKQIIHASS